MTTVRRRLEEWSVPVEALLDVDLDAEQFPEGEDVHCVQAWCDPFELVVHVASPPPPVTPLEIRQREERLSLAERHAAEREALG